LDESYCKRIVANKFGSDYEMKWAAIKTTTFQERAVVLQPKQQPSRFAATMAPMFKTRFKYEITFLLDEQKPKVTHRDLLEITFNRSNGATPQQQERISRNRQDFAELVQQLQAQIDFDQDEQAKHKQEN
jgi:hypothetical protein